MEQDASRLAGVVMLAAVAGAVIAEAEPKIGFHAGKVSVKLPRMRDVVAEDRLGKEKRE